MIHCGICGKAKTADVQFICCHCINGSPAVLLRDKMNLLILRQEVEQLKTAVEDQLETGFAGEGQLGRQLQKLDIYNEKRRLIKLRQRLQLARNKVQLKRNKYNELLQIMSTNEYLEESTSATDSIDLEEQAAEESASLDTLSHILARNQKQLFAELCRWFRIRKSDEDDVFSYTIWGLPMVNLKNGSELDPSIMVSSMRYLQQYLQLAFRIWLFKAICDKPIENDRNIIENFTQLIYDTLDILRARKLVSKSVSIRDILIRYDLDGMIYHLSQNKYLSSLEDASNSYPPTMQNIKQLVMSMIPSI